MKKDNPAYYAILTADVRYDNRLTPNAKLLYAEITALCNQKGFCWSTNAYFADLYNVSKTSISNWIAQLIEFGYLESHMIYKDGTKEILNRYLSLVIHPIKENFNTPIKENFKDNNTSINNTINIHLNENFYKSENDFLEDWNEARKKLGGVKHSNFNVLHFNDKINFNNLIKTYSREDFKNGMRGLFMQKTTINSIKSSPGHFLDKDNIQKYIDAYFNKKQLYSEPVKEQRL